MSVIITLQRCGKFYIINFIISDLCMPYKATIYFERMHERINI